jgi:hypothetical protein
MGKSIFKTILFVIAVIFELVAFITLLFFNWFLMSFLLCFISIVVYALFINKSVKY